MRTMFFGAGPLGSTYAHLLHQAGKDVTVLARGERHEWLKQNGLVLVNELTGEKEVSAVKVVNELKSDDTYNLVVVLVRKNKLSPVFEILAASPRVENVLFMGNNTLGFDLFYWLPEFTIVLAVKQLLESKFAEVAFAMHAISARDEMEDLAREFQELKGKTSVDTPNLDTLWSFIN